MIRSILFVLMVTGGWLVGSPQNSVSYDDFFNNSKSAYGQYSNYAKQQYSSFREKANKDYIEFLRKAWGEYEAYAPVPKPKEENVPPRPYHPPVDETPIEVTPEEVPIPEVTPQPQPLEPIEEKPNPVPNRTDIEFYGIKEQIRIPSFARLSNSINTTTQIAEAWNTLCNDEIDNTLYDCLQLREKYNLSDWAYLQFLDKLSQQYCGKGNSATLLMAFLYCQSGYQMRLALDGRLLYMLFGSQHQIFDMGYFALDNTNFYPYGNPSKSIQICNAEFEGETPLSLLITKEHLFGGAQSQDKIIKSKRYSNASASTNVNAQLIDFYNTYPTSCLNNNPMTRWAMYANAPLAQKTKEALYPSLRKAMADRSKQQAADILLNWIQTGFEYEYDDKVWGHDRAFFAEETLYYPYCDCEDRSILFSRLVRDLLGLDVALIYYPGHLATAVCFNEEVNGDAMMIHGRKFIVCDPTYIGAPVGSQMPGLEYDKAEAIILNK